MMEKSELLELLPEVIKAPKLPGEWDPEKAVAEIKRLTGVAKPAVADIVAFFWIAHEKIVRKEAKGWTWDRFCKEAGYAHTTPLRWFEKYSLPITKTAGPDKLTIVSSPKTTPKETAPEVKKHIAPVVEALSARFEYTHKSGSLDLSTARFWRIDPAVIPVRYSAAETEVLQFLRARASASVEAIMDNASTCSPNSARRAVYSLAKRGSIRRSNPGARGVPALYEVVRSHVAQPTT